MHKHISFERVSGALGIVGIAAGYTLLYTTQWGGIWFYHLVWWPFVLLMEGVNGFLGRPVFRDRSLVQWARILGLSAGIWFLFEVYNLYIGNWYYVGLVEPRPVRWSGIVLAFATVLPALWGVRNAVFEVLPEVLNQRPRWEAPSWVHGTLWTFGVIGTLGPFVVPDVFFPFVWVGWLLVLDLYEYQMGHESFLHQLEDGRYRNLIAWLVSGLICGFLWEYWNHLAAAGWIYTVPGLGRYRLFEMPLLGYLGFAPFALMCWRIFSFVNIRLDWCRWSGRLIFWVLLIGFCLMTLLGIDLYTLGSVRPDLADFEGWTPLERQKLNAMGLHRPQRARVLSDDAGIVRKLRLIELGRMGTRTANCLWKANIRSVEKVMQTSSQNLAQVIQQCRGSRYRFWLRRVRDWKQRG